MSSSIVTHSLALLAGASAVILAFSLMGPKKSDDHTEYSLADQPQRFANAKAAKNTRMLNIDALYNPSYVRGKTIIVTGGNRGLGLAIAKEFAAQGGKVIITVRAPTTIDGLEVISGIDVTDNNCGAKLVAALKGRKVDILVNNAGYFMVEKETLKNLDFNDEIKTIDICAIGPLRITAALFNAGLLTAGSKVAMITSQGGSIAWRSVQCPTGGDYGHHISKAAANMMGVLVANELKEQNIAVSILHPGFNKTDMTAKYAHIWEVEGAVDASIGAKRVVHEIGLMGMGSTGAFINCEDGLQIPW